jgi:hypothetical protein
VNAVFVDTAGGWRAPIALICVRGLSAARDAALEAGQTLVTSDFVVDETLTLIRVRLVSRRQTCGGGRSTTPRACDGSALTMSGSSEGSSSSFSTTTRIYRLPIAQALR